MTFGHEYHFKLKGKKAKLKKATSEKSVNREDESNKQALLSFHFKV